MSHGVQLWDTIVNSESMMKLNSPAPSLYQQQSALFFKSLHLNLKHFIIRMLRCLPACFSVGVAVSTAAAPFECTSVYATHLGEASLNWRRAAIGLSVSADILLLPVEENEPASDHLRFGFHIRLPWRKKGFKKLRLKTADGRRCAIELAWDLSRAIFTDAGGPEPAAGFFVAVAVDGEIALVAGDRHEEAHRRIDAVSSRNCDGRSAPISRTVQVKLKEIGMKKSYTAMARFGGRERIISITIDLEEMRVRIDGEMALKVRRIWWKFRGSEKVAMDGGELIEATWDLHRWIFRSDSCPKRSPAAAKAGDAVFVFRFEEEGEGHFGKRCGGRGFWGKIESWSESSSGSWSTTTGASSPTVGGWGSPEEAEMRSSDAGGFTLIVCGWKD
ncbi:hypothetical protein AXF42_Ash001246 [Apostasia shenzhenica]|uniref:Uncharacterized protein n=1 Tax=Apostasia shenzhenica TaxID=1088818 RepID=A0A2I0AUC4_9ASPA|nr:hypothetical protein AXF42_Ash001246 [Apostasia shenzhenica]